MGAEQTVGAVQLSARLCGVSPPVTRRLLITGMNGQPLEKVKLGQCGGWGLFASGHFQQYT
jgi:hypothetical protein